jgi:formylglycine-generating enzyme required for sulfatase activity
VTAGVAGLAVGMLLLLGSYMYYEHVQEKRAIDQVNRLLSAAAGEDLSERLASLKQLKKWAKPYLADQVGQLSGPQLKRAVAALASLQDRGVKELVDDLLQADQDRQDRWPILLAELQQNPTARDSLRQRFKSVDAPKDQSVLLASLFVLHDYEFVLPHLRFTKDPTVRTGVIHALADMGVSPKALAQALDTTTNPQERFALLLALRHYQTESWPETLKAKLKSWFKTDPDPAVHSACELLLRLDNPKALDELQQDFAKKKLDRGTWFIDSAGNTLIRIKADPAPFWMGTRKEDIAFRASKEPRYQARLLGAFAISTKEVTVAQFEAFFRETFKKAKTSFRSLYDELRALDDETDFKKRPIQLQEPVTFITVPMAAAYCNWLSRKEGLEPCYPQDVIDELVKDWNLDVAVERPFGRYNEGSELSYKVDLTKPGYRLPSEVEWEYACRAGTESARYFGTQAEYLLWYAHGNFTPVPGQEFFGKLIPVGMLCPNDYGLFDMLGNAAEWCQDWRTTENDKDKIHVDKAEANAYHTGVGDGFYYSALRGGSYLDQKEIIRSTYRVMEENSATLSSDFGFRVVRSLKENYPGVKDAH